MRADPVFGPMGTTCCVAVSKAWSGGAAGDCGSEGTGRELQACMASPYPGARLPILRTVARGSMAIHRVGAAAADG
jgi:hypothetical protein